LRTGFRHKVKRGPRHGRCVSLSSGVRCYARADAAAASRGPCCGEGWRVRVRPPLNDPRMDKPAEPGFFPSDREAAPRDGERRLP